MLYVGKIYFTDLTSVCLLQKGVRTWLPRGRRSRNKVSVGEPLDGSLEYFRFLLLKTKFFFFVEGKKK